jgi:hypothetical protein
MPLHGAIIEDPATPEDSLAVMPLAFPDGTVLNLGAGKHRIRGTVNLDLPEWNADWEPIP